MSVINADLIDDIDMMHEHYGIDISHFDKEKLWKFVEFRFNFLQEEVTEGKTALEERNAEEVVDALIDLIVVAVGTLGLLKVDITDAWDEVLEANMSKEIGIKPSRPNPLGLPDLIKPAGWKAPTHEGNHGLLG
jgi:NTP pyrophosphatase (non-canonical NTP hydrolase)